VRLMVLGAALECGLAAVALSSVSSLNSLFARTGTFDAHAIAVAHAETIATNSGVAAAIWLIMAYASYHARTDAPRIVAAVLFYLGTEDLAQYFKDPNTVGTRTLAVLIWLLGLAALLLLFSSVLPKAIRDRARRRQHLHDCAAPCGRAQ
jgi:hypothetical protein